MFTKKLKQEGLRKTAAVFTAISFMLSIFTSGGFAAPSQMPMRAQSAKIAPALPADYIVPFNIGRVTDAVNYKSDKVIVQIQDLHSHEETQRNIAGIISFLDSKYKIGNIYVEGAVGDIDTSWLAGIEDEAVKTSVIDSLLAKGVLTGAEYYSAVSGKTKVLKGMEDKDAYLENFRRLIRINSSKDEIKAAFPEIKEMFAFLSDKYYSKENKKIDETVRKYREGKISFERYFAYIVKKARDKNVYFGFYPALIAFSNIIKAQSRLNKKKINAQMTAFMDELKEKVSFSEYKEIVSNFGKPETEAVFYFKLAEAYEKYGYNGKYGELAEFLRFINLNQHINPLDLVREEKELLREVREKYSVSGVERDLLFISDFLGLMESFLNNKITAAEYKYFERELPRFKTLWAQYTLVSGLPSLDGYYSLFEGFYSLNLARNNIFVDNVTESKGGKNSGELASFDKNSVNGISAMISAAKELDIVVAGGFHTQDISRILQSSKQSYVVVTPNVTRDASAADRLFNEDIIRISKFIPANAYQKAIASARLNFIDDADKSQILNAVVGTYISKEVLDAALSALDEQTRDAAAADPRLLADIVKNEIIANIAGQLEQKGISDFNVAGIEIAENGYKVTAGSRETGQKTFNVDEEGASDSGQIQPFSVPTANNIVKTVRLASLLMSFGAAGMFFAAAPVVIPVSLAAASLIFGAFGISLKKSSAAVSEAQRQAKSSEPLTEAQAAQLKENIKNAIRNYVGEEKYDRLGVEIYDTAGSDDIAHVSTSRTATGKTIVLEIDLLAFSKLLDNDKTQAERILTHEARHILGHGEAGAYLANLLPKPLVKFYNAGKNRAYAEFYSSLNAMKALQETNAGFETRRKTARNLIDAAAGLMAFMKNGTLAHSERRKILKLISEAVNVLKAGNINELAGAETVENEATGSSSVEPASSGLAEGYNLLVSAVRTAFVKVSDNAGVDRIADEALEGAGIEKGSINESFFKNLIKKLLEKRSGAQQAESLTMGFEDSEEAANRSKANFFGSAAAQWVREKMGAVSLKSIISDKRNAAAAERVDFVSYPLNGGIGSSLERKAYVAAVRKYLSELDAARKAQDAAKIADLKARMKSGEYLSEVSDSEIKNARLGAKASDLYFEVNGELKSVSELKMERMLIERDLGIYADVTMKMLVSSETRESVEELFNRESMKYAGRTYKELFKGIEMLEQAAYPVVCEKNGEIAFVMSDVAPGGHGYWGYYLLKALLSRTDAATGAAAIGVVSNEDGLNNKIPAELAGFMAREKIGIVMLSTTATDLDKKGGKIGVIKRNGRYVTGMMEAAQAESAGQTKEFQELGLTIGERGEQFFNTNTVLLNASILAPMLRELADIIGEEEFEKVIMPDLIENKDKKTGNIKLEGAIGSVMLNLNAFFETTDNEEVKALKRKYVGEGQLVRIVNAEEELRSSVFTPVKKAIDIWFQKSSGYYGLNEDRMELEEKTKNPIPAFNLEGKQYEDIRYLERNWKNTDAADIRSLSVRGEGVSFGGVKLKGEVNIINESGEDFAINRETLAETGLISEDDDSALFRLPVEDGKIVLEDVEMIKNKKGEVIIRSMKPTKAVNIDDSDGVEEITDAALSARGIKGESDKKFFKNLVKKFIARRTGAERAESLTMGFEDSEEAADKSEANFFGSGVSRWVREKMGAVSLKKIISDKNNKLAAKNVLLESYPLNGGIGSSLERKAYVAAVRKYLSELDAARKAQDAAKIADLKARMKSGEYLSEVSDSEIKNARLGAKASDLYFEVNGELKSVSELKMERMLIERDLGIYADVTMKMLVSSETVESVEELFNRESMKYAGRTYKEMFKNIEMLEQAAYPVAEIDRESGRIRFITSQVAPGGHGYWGYYLLKALLSRTDAATGAAAIGVVSNEDGLNNKIPAELAGFMAREKIGIVMLSTTATDLDKKGGKIGVIKRNGRYVTGMMEAAQAESAGQTKEFQELGLTIGERGEQFFNTNTVLLNASILAPMLRELADIIGEEEFEKVIMPDLIENKDKKTGNIKLEGAIGSVMLNLNAFFETTDNEEVKALKRKYVGEGQLVRIVNAEEELRSSVFTPVKKAIDIWFQKSSGYYGLNEDRMELEEKTKNPIPAFNLEGKQYEDIRYLERNWKNTDAADIRSLSVKGENIQFNGVSLKGAVKIINDSDKPLLIDMRFLEENGLISRNDEGGMIFGVPFEKGLPVLEDIEIVQNKKGTIRAVSTKSTEQADIGNEAEVKEITETALEARRISDENDKSFFRNLVKSLTARITGAERAESLTMGFEDSEEAADKSEANFFGSGVSRWVREKMGAASLKNIISDKANREAAKTVIIENNPLNGGIGSSLERKAYVASVRKYLAEVDGAKKAGDIKKIAALKAQLESGAYLDKASAAEAKDVQLGAKASDLYFEVNGELKSVSELKMERMAIERSLGIYADVMMKMLVSSETVESVEELFNRETLGQDGKTYKEMFKNIEMLEQAAYPVAEIDRENGRIRFITSQVAPGGHGYWGYYLLKALLSRTDAATGAAAIGVVSNEDGLNNKIPAELAGFMAREKIGIVMLSTTATDLDKKGGKIGVIKRNGRYVTGMMEAAQAESAGQTKEFQELGLTIGERGEQFFNTNTVLLNASILAPMLRELADIIGEEEFEKVIMPDLIENKDKKTGNIKLEGAIGSVMLNLNAFFETTDNEEVKALKRKYVGEGQLVRIVNAEEELRSSVFTPVKKAIDIWFQEESGYYKFNPDTYELEEATANSVPAFSLEGKDYEDIKYLKKNWTNVDAKDIKSLTVKGEGVKFKNAVLAGDVRVINESGEDIVISQETLGPEFASDAGGRIIIQDMEIVVGKDGRVKVRDSAGTAAGKSFLRRIAGALLKFLAGLVNRDTFVFKEAPGMLGRTYTIVLSDFSPDSINAVSKRAAEIARLGINVNVIAPMNDNITDFTALGLISGEETGLRNLFTRKDKIENGREVNYYYYSRKTAAEFSSVKGDDKTDWANETLKWLRSRAVSEDDFGVIEVGLSSELSFEQVNALFPEAYIAASVRQNEDLKFAESKGFIQTVRPGTEKNAVIEAGERFRFLKQGGDMRTSPLFSTVIDVSGTDITDAAFADALLDMDLDTAVLKVNAAVLTQDTVNAIKQFMLSAQEKGLKTVIEFKAENEREALSLLTDMGSLLSQLRVNSRGVDGVRLDFNSLAGREMENVLTQSNLKSLRLAVNRENADGIIGIKAEDAGRSIEVNNALIMRLSALNIRNVITVETKSDITDAGQAWLDFSTGGKMYNKQTADALQIAGNIESALEAQAAVLGLDWEIISAMKNTAEGVNIAGMIKNIVRKKLSFFKATPAGRYDAGRKFALSKSDIGFKAGQEVSLYRLLNDMRNAEKADAVLVSKLFEIFPNAKTKQLGEAAASSDAEKISLVFEEAKGYLQGILERSQSDIHIRATEFKVRTDADIYRAALVEARLYTVINNADIDAVQEVPYSSQLRDNKAYTDEKDAAVNAELARARELVGSVLARAESESIVALQPEVREAVNILTSLTEGKTLSSSANKAMAVADLLAMLALYADKVEKTAIEKGRDNLASMQEGVRAMLSAA